MAREKLSYWPAKEVEGERLDLLSIHFAIDWGGRSAECEFQSMDSGSTISATYYYLTDEWSREGWSASDTLTASIRNIFSAFDDGSRPTAEAA